jgi:hypothetical protein
MMNISPPRLSAWSRNLAWIALLLRRPITANSIRAGETSTRRDPRWTSQIAAEVQKTTVHLRAVLEERHLSLGTARHGTRTAACRCPRA